MGAEIERKFLVNHTKWKQLNKPKGLKYKQGYLVNEADKVVRIRVTDSGAYLTIKGITSGITRKEFEYQIPNNDAIELLDNFSGAKIEKIRYKISHEGKLWEVDEFSGDNLGLIIAELELKSEAETFTLPDWVTLEVSNDARYYNSNLSINPFKNW